MNTLLSAPRAALIALALGTAGVTASFAQTTTTATPTPPTYSPGGWHYHHHRESVLTAAERAQLKKAKEQALAANGTLRTEQASLKQQFETLKSSSATQAQWEAFHQQKETYRKDLKAAELLIDPTLAPIFTKLEAAHQRHHPSST